MTARPTSGLTVRAAGPGDAVAIRGLDGLSASSIALLDHDLAAADRCCLVAEVAGDTEVVGYAAAIVQLGEAQVLDLVVASVHRGRGIGGRLLDALLEEAAVLGAAPVSLEVAPDNAPAQALYRRRGFVVEGRRPRYYPDGADALIMWRRPTRTGRPDGAPDDSPVDSPVRGTAGVEVAATSTSLPSRGQRSRQDLEREDD